MDVTGDPEDDGHGLGGGLAAPGVRLLGPAEIRALAGDLALRPAKRLGQNFMHDANTVRRIVRLAGVQPSDRVVEVGPGLGSLTLGLLEAGARVTAVEIDPRLAARLPATAAGRAGAAAARLRVVTADALQVGAAELGPGEGAVPDGGAASADGTVPERALPADGIPAPGPAGPSPLRLVANLPYNVAVPILLHLLAAEPAIATVLVLVQREVAERVAAVPGSKTYGVPSAKAAWYGPWTLAGRVPRGVFWPEPRVDSALLRLEARRDAGAPSEREAVFALIDAAFAERRKTLRRALSAWAGSGPAAERRLRAAGIDPSARAEQLQLDDYRRLAAVDG